MTPERRAEIRERWSRATKGPWCERDVYTLLRFYGKCYIGDGFCDDDECELSEPDYHGGDPAFIAHSWADVRDLLDEVERLREFVEEIRDGLSCVSYDCTIECYHCMAENLCPSEDSDDNE